MTENFEIIEIYTTQWDKIILASILAIVGILLITEIVKRIFYYIILGTLTPTKKEITKSD